MLDTVIPCTYHTSWLNAPQQKGGGTPGGGKKDEQMRPQTVWGMMLIGGLVVLLAAVAPSVAFAATKYFAGVNQCPNGSHWSSTSCWASSTLPVTGDDVVMDNTQTASGGVPCQTT